MNAFEARLRVVVSLSITLLITSCTSTKGPEKLSDRFLVFPPASFSGDVYVDLNSRVDQYPKLAIAPFKAPVQHAGAAVSDVFATELLRTGRYSLVERGQIESVLKEQELGLTGAVEESTAARLGKILGVNGVVVGTVSEYGFEKAGFSKVPSVSLTVRMVDSTSGKIVWSISRSAVGKKGVSLSQQTDELISDMVTALGRAWMDAGDNAATGLPPPEGLTARGGVRQVTLEWKPHTSKLVAGYEVRRRDPGSDAAKLVVRLRNNFEDRLTWEDQGLQDVTQYAYEVKTVSKYALISAKAATAEAVTAGAPQPPGGITGKGGVRQVTLSWVPSLDSVVCGYIVYREQGNNLLEIARLRGREKTSCTDGALQLKDNCAYVYRVRSYNTAAVESELSTPITVTTLPAPSQVTGVSATVGMPRAIAVRWNAAAEDEDVTAYLVQRADQPTGPFVEAGRVKGRSVTRFVDSGGRGMELKNGASYYYRVTAINRGNVPGSPSELSSGATKPAPPVVKGLSVSPDSAGGVRLRWLASSIGDLSFYRIYRSFGKNLSGSPIATVLADAVTYDDKSPPQGASCYYRVSAVDKDALEGALSEPVGGNAVPFNMPPVKPAMKSGNKGEQR